MNCANKCLQLYWLSSGLQCKIIRQCIPLLIKGTAGVGVIIAERWIHSVVDVVRLNERIMYVKLVIGSKRHSLQAGELSQRTQAAVQIVSNLPAPSNEARFTVFLGMPAMRTRWTAGAAAHKSG